MEKQLRMVSAEEQRDTEREMHEEGCNHSEAVRRLEKRAAAKKSVPVVHAPEHWKDSEDDREE